MRLSEHVFIGITNDGDLVSLELNYNDLNKGTKWYNPHHYLSPHIYTEIIDEETGEREAKERLAEEEYWKDLGYLHEKIPDCITNNIDWDKVAQEVIDNDGWQMTNGEFYELGDFGDKTYYINLNGIGHEYVRADFKKLFITEEEFKYLWGKKEWKITEKAAVKKLRALFDKPKNEKKIIKAFLEEKNGETDD